MEPTVGPDGPPCLGDGTADSEPGARALADATKPRQPGLRRFVRTDHDLPVPAFAKTAATAGSIHRSIRSKTASIEDVIRFPPCLYVENSGFLATVVPLRLRPITG